MRTSNRKSRNPVIVAEAGKKHLKLVQLVRGRGGKATAVYFKNFERVDDALIGQMAAAVKKLRLAHVPVIGCLPRQAVNVRLLEVPSTDSEEIENMVELQVGKQTPYSKDEIVSDYRIIGSTRQGYTRIMLIVVQKGLMRQRFRMLEDIGLEVENMSVSSEGVLNWYRSTRGKGEPGKATVLLDIDSSYTDFAVITGGQLVFTRSVLVGADELSQDSVDARDRFLQEVEHSLQIYRSEAHGKASASRIILTGAGAHIRGLSESIGERFGFPVEAVDSAPAMTGGLAGVEKTSLTAVVGMASAPEALEFSLVPEAVETRRSLTYQARRMTSMGGLILGTVWLVAALGLCTLLKEVVRHNKQQSLLVKKTSITADVIQKKELTRMIMDRRNSRHSPVSILLDLHRQDVVPGSIAFDSIEIVTGQRIRLKGKARNFEDVDMLVAGLKESDTMPSGTISVPTRKKAPDYRWEFEVVIVIGEGE